MSSAALIRLQENESSAQTSRKQHGTDGCPTSSSSVITRMYCNDCVFISTDWWQVTTQLLDHMYNSVMKTVACRMKSSKSVVLHVTSEVHSLEYIVPKATDELSCWNSKFNNCLIDLNSHCSWRKRFGDRASGKPQMLKSRCDLVSLSQRHLTDS